MNTCYVTTILAPVIGSVKSNESDLPLMCLAYSTAMGRLTPALYFSDEKLLKAKRAHAPS